MPGLSNSVAIIGGGFSGTLQAINLLRHDGPRAILIERSARQLGRGVAYSAAESDHLLNVRASNMSAYPDEPDHFVNWLAGESIASDGFVPRQVYGRYLRAMLEQAAKQAPEKLEIVTGNAIGLDEEADGVRIALDDGRSVAADMAVLSLGNLRPHTPPGLDPDVLGDDRYVADPWAGEIAAGLTADDTVMLIGTGLTAIDAALLLDTHGFEGRIVALSRRGLVPRAHSHEPRQAAELLEKPPLEASALVRFMRRRSDARGWRDAVDDLRPMTQMMWGGATDAMRARFLRHLRPFWDVHRHRLAPEVARRIAAMREDGRLTFVAGKTIAAEIAGNGVAITWRPRGESEPRADHVRRIINCTGPQGDLLQTDEPLLRALLAAGTIAPDPMRLGLAVDSQSRTVRRDGGANERIFAIGPMTRGALWEIIAVPDLRQQTWTLARRLSNAHWVDSQGL